MKPSKCNEYKKLRAEGLTFASIGERFGVTRQAVSLGCKYTLKMGKYQRMFHQMSPTVEYTIAPCSSIKAATLRRSAQKMGIQIETKRIKKINGYIITKI